MTDDENQGEEEERWRGLKPMCGICMREVPFDDKDVYTETRMCRACHGRMANGS